METEMEWFGYWLVLTDEDFKMTDWYVLANGRKDETNSEKEEFY